MVQMPLIQSSRIPLAISQSAPSPPVEGTRSELSMKAFRSSLISKTVLSDLWLLRNLSEGWDRLHFCMQHQQQTNWCWAAGTVSISLYYDPSSTWTQCTLVNAEFNQTTCCSNGGSLQCNKPWYPDLSLTRTGNLANMSTGAAAFSSVDTEIDGGRPIGVRIGWSGGGGHFVILVGYLERLSLLGDNLVAVEDPWYGPSDMPYDTFRTSYQGSGSWTHTYYTQS